METIPRILHRHRREEDGIFVPLDISAADPGTQAHEVTFRRKVASVGSARDNILKSSLARVAEHHAIPVMDFEADRFLAEIPPGGALLDVGGGFGWPWRSIASKRPDVQVIVVDLVRENLLTARAMLGDLIDRQIFLALGNACHLSFDDGEFDGVWTVQTFQHIEAVEKAYAEASRLLRPGGVFANYVLNDTAFLRFLYGATGRRWHREGPLQAYFLRRMSSKEKTFAERAFDAPARERFTEVLFCPELRIRFGGKPDSALGRLDARLGGSNWQRYFSRQHSLHLKKPGNPA